MTYVNLAFDELGASVVFEVFEQGGRNVLVAYNRSRQNPLPTPEGEGVLIAFPDSLQPETVNAEHHKQSARGFTISVRTVGGGILVTNASATLDGLRGINNRLWDPESDNPDTTASWFIAYPETVPPVDINPPTITAVTQGTQHPYNVLVTPTDSTGNTNPLTTFHILRDDERQYLERLPQTALFFEQSGLWNTDVGDWVVSGNGRAVVDATQQSDLRYFANVSGYPEHLVRFNVVEWTAGNVTIIRGTEEHTVEVNGPGTYEQAFAFPTSTNLIFRVEAGANMAFDEVWVWDRANNITGAFTDFHVRLSTGYGYSAKRQDNQGFISIGSAQVNVAIPDLQLWDAPQNVTYEGTTAYNGILRWTPPSGATASYPFDYYQIRVKGEDYKTLPNLADNETDIHVGEHVKGTVDIFVVDNRGFGGAVGSAEFEGLPPIWETEPTPPNANTNQYGDSAYSYDIKQHLNETDGVTVTLQAGSLPPGFTMTNGVITGSTLKSFATVTLTARATNQNGYTDQEFEWSCNTVFVSGYIQLQANNNWVWRNDVSHDPFGVPNLNGNSTQAGNTGLFQFRETAAGSEVYRILQVDRQDNWGIWIKGRPDNGTDFNHVWQAAGAEEFSRELLLHIDEALQFDGTWHGQKVENDNLTNQWLGGSGSQTTRVAHNNTAQNAITWILRQNP